jgi:hypothetical protein
MFYGNHLVPKTIFFENECYLTEEDRTIPFFSNLKVGHKFVFYSDSSESLQSYFEGLHKHIP